MRKIFKTLTILATIVTAGFSCASAPEVVYFNEVTKNTPTVVMKLEAKEGQVENLTAKLETLVAEARKDSSNLCYNVYQDIDVPTRFIVYQIWANEAASKAYAQTVPSCDTLVNTEYTATEVYERSISTMPKSSEGSLVLFANINAIDGKAAELQTILEDLIPATMAEVGAEHYELHKRNGDANGFMFHETWTTVPHWDAHMLTPHLVEFLGVKDNYVAGDIAISRTKQII